MIHDRDIKIMRELRRNSRSSLASIAKKTGIPLSTIYDRIKTKEIELIKKHTSILDFPKLGYNIRAKVLLRIWDTEQFQKFAVQHPNINSVFKLNSEYNFMIDCIFRYMSEMQELTAEIDKFGVRKQQTHFVSEEIARENFMN